MRFGFHVSPSIAWMKTDVDNDGTGNRAGFSYGLIIEKNTGHSYTFATGIDVTYNMGVVKMINGDFAGAEAALGSKKCDYNLAYIYLNYTFNQRH